MLVKLRSMLFTTFIDWSILLFISVVFATHVRIFLGL